MKIAVYSASVYELPFLTQVFEGQHELLFIEKPLNIDSVDLAETCDAVMLFTSDSGTALVLEKLAEKHIKFIALRSAGYDHVDLKSAATFNLKVANVASYSREGIFKNNEWIWLQCNLL